MLLYAHHSSSCPEWQVRPLQNDHIVLCLRGVTEGSAFRVYRARDLNFMDSSAWPAPLAGQTILVAEEEASISFNIEAQLIEAGANVVTVKDQRQGLLAAIGDRLTAAVLADKLGDDPLDPICDCLAQSLYPLPLLDRRQRQARSKVGASSDPFEAVRWPRADR